MCIAIQTGQIEVLNLASQEHRNELKEKNKDILKLQAEKDELQANHTVQVPLALYMCVIMWHSSYASMLTSLNFYSDTNNYLFFE